MHTYVRSSPLPAVLWPVIDMNSYGLIGPLVSSERVDTVTEVRCYYRDNAFPSLHEAFMEYYDEQNLHIQELVLI